MVVNRRQVDPGGRDYLPQRRRGVPVVPDQLLGRIENLLLRVSHSTVLIVRFNYMFWLEIVK
jgi:hypothetical protein